MKRLLWVLYLLLPVLAYAQKEKDVKLNVVYVGNSITQGALLAHPEQEAPPVQASGWLRQQVGISGVEYANMGASGKTTVDFLPASETFFPRVQQAAEKLTQQNPKATLVFSMMLGTNDSAVKGPNGAPVSPAQYYTNVKVIVDELLAAYPKAVVVLHRPIWYSPNTHNNAVYLKEGLQRLTSYYPILQKLVKYYREHTSYKVVMGDTEAYDYFSNHQGMFTSEDGQAGVFHLHPNKEGAARLGEFWGKAVYDAVFRGAMNH